MALKDQFADDMGIFFDTDDFAEEIVYIAQADQQQYVINAQVRYEGNPEIASGDKARWAIVDLPKSGISTQNMDEVVINGDTWRVDKVLEEDDYVATISIRREESKVI